MAQSMTLSEDYKVVKFIFLLLFCCLSFCLCGPTATGTFEYKLVGRFWVQCKNVTKNRLLTATEKKEKVPAMHSDSIKLSFIPNEEENSNEFRGPQIQSPLKSLRLVV